MIQRQQTLWLLLSAVCSVLTLLYTFYSGNEMVSTMSTYVELDSASNFPLLILTIISILLSVSAIFLYKTRKTQLKVVIAGIVLAVLILVVYFMEVKKFETGNFALTSVYAFLIPIGYIMAARGIWKDEKLVKSLDKLR
ncbi:MAG: DUF4293 domain-containing protein [Chitinophagaceae bacterium]